MAATPQLVAFRDELARTVGGTPVPSWDADSVSLDVHDPHVGWVRVRLTPHTSTPNHAHDRGDT